MQMNIEYYLRFGVNFILRFFLDNQINYSIIRLFYPRHDAVELHLKEIKKSSEIVFIMGSGYSINDISKCEWDHFRKNGDILSFNLFFKGEFIPIDFHIVREMGRKITRSPNLLKIKIRLQKCYNDMLDNPKFQETVFFILKDEDATNINIPLYMLKLFSGKKISFFKNLKDKTINGEKYGLPTKDSNKMPHNGATLFDAINISYILGYKKIVLVGIDLYDRRYFWLREDETLKEDLNRGASYKDIHNTAPSVLRIMKEWKRFFKKEGIELFVYNPSSLLTEFIPVYDIK